MARGVFAGAHGGQCGTIGFRASEACLTLFRMTVCSLLDAPLHRDLDIEALPADIGLRRRLLELGVRRGAPISAVQRTAGGGLLLRTGPSRVAIDRATCAGITVCLASTGGTCLAASGAADATGSPMCAGGTCAVAAHRAAAGAGEPSASAAARA